MNRFPTPDERWPRRGEPLPKTKIEEHPNCGTPDCCMQCETAVPVPQFGCSSQKILNQSRSVLTGGLNDYCLLCSKWK